MTTELLETIAQLETRVNELEYQLHNSEDELVRLRAELDDSIEVSANYLKLLVRYSTALKR